MSSLVMYVVHVYCVNYTADKTPVAAGLSLREEGCYDLDPHLLL